MICRNCGNMIEDTGNDVKFCPECGAELNPEETAEKREKIYEKDTAVEEIEETKETAEEDEELTVVYAPQGQQTGAASASGIGASAGAAGASAVGNVSGGVRTRNIVLAVIFGVLAAVFIICAIATVNTEKYRELTSQYDEYIANERETQQLADSYGGTGLLGSGYQSISDTWEELVDLTEDQIWKIRIRAIIFGVIGGVCAVGFICILCVTLRGREKEKQLIQ